MAQVLGAGSVIEVAVPVAVALVDPLREGLAVAGASDRVGLGRHQRVQEGPASANAAKSGEAWAVDGT
jgi:hypothetical protein